MNKSTGLANIVLSIEASPVQTTFHHIENAQLVLLAVHAKDGTIKQNSLQR